MLLRLGVAVLASAFAGSPAAGPPAGLTAYGRTVWNLDALLHDTFGTRQVWEDYGRGPIPNFSTKFVDLASSVPWAYTFATAPHSRFRAVRLRHPPKIGDYVTGENVPFKIRGAASLIALAIAGTIRMTGDFNRREAVVFCLVVAASLAVFAGGVILETHHPRTAGCG